MLVATYLLLSHTQKMYLMDAMDATDGHSAVIAYATRLMARDSHVAFLTIMLNA